MKKAVLIIVAFATLAGTNAFAADKKQEGKPRVSEIKLTLAKFKKVKKGLSEEDLFKRFGMPEKDVGSGIHMYQYALTDGTKVQVGCVDTVLYVDHLIGEKRIRLVGDKIKGK